MLIVGILMDEATILTTKDIEGRKKILIKQFKALHKDILRLIERSPLSVPELQSMLLSIEEMLRIMHEVTILNIHAEAHELKP